MSDSAGFLKNKVTAEKIRQWKLSEEFRSAALAGDLSQIVEMIGSGFDVNDRGPSGLWSTALSSVVYKFYDSQTEQVELDRYFQCMEHLLEAGADPNLGEPTAFEMAAELKNKDILKRLIQFGADVNSANADDGLAPLHRVLMVPEEGMPVDDGCAIELISAGADLMVKDRHGRLPIHYAAGAGFLMDLQEILNRRPEDVNAIDDEGASPIMLAAVGGHENIVKLLESYGAEAPDELISILEAAVLEKNKLEKVRIDDCLQSLDVSGDDDVYLKWARDIGFDQEVQAPYLELENSDDYVPTVRHQIDSWFAKKYTPVIDALWEKYVPKSGGCTVLQGEMARCICRLEGELFKSGMMNMGEGYYDSLVDKISEVVLRQGNFSLLVQKVFEADALVVKGADYSIIMSTSSLFQFTDVESTLKRMKMVVAAWCIANPSPIEFVPSTFD